MTGQIDLAGVLAALAAAVPALRDANCVGSAELFDPAEVGETKDDLEYRFSAALALCRSCRCQTDCLSWLESLPTDERPGGIVAGTVVKAGTRGWQPMVA